VGDEWHLRPVARSPSRGIGAIPETGGLYAFLRNGWGRLYGFLFGWAQLVIIRAASLGAISITFAEYFIRVLGYDPRIAPYTCIPIGSRQWQSWSMTFNILGVKWGALVTNLTTLAKYGGLMFIIILALTQGCRRQVDTSPRCRQSFSIAPFGLAWCRALGL
jgi:amino acid transporter